LPEVLRFNSRSKSLNEHLKGYLMRYRLSERFDEYFIIRICNQEKDRPYVYLFRDGVGNIRNIYLQDNIHEWMIFYSISYTIFSSVSSNGYSADWNIEIPDERMAMLFKLTWI
jgi:hypothetical protein